MEQQILQLATAIESLRQQLGPVSNSSFLALQQQVNALTAQATATLNIAQTPRHWKPARPDTLSCPRVSGRPGTWLFIVKTYFAAANVSTSDRVPLATSLLRGDATLWWQCRVRLVSEGGLLCITTWDDFHTAFLEQFAPVGNVRQARDSLSTLSQKTSVAKYATEFRMLTLQIPNIAAKEQLDRFIRGPKPAVRREVEIREPSDLARAMRLADRADIDQHITSLPPESVSQPAHAAVPGGPKPMDIGFVQANLSANERGTLTREGRCFKCKKQGHRSNNCKSV